MPITIFLMLSNFLKDKSWEISYVLIRVAWSVKRTDLRDRLEKLAMELLENASRASTDNRLDNFNETFATVAAVDGLVRLGHSIYEIEPVNATILVRELDNLNAAMRQAIDFSQAELGNAAIDSELPDLETLFRVKNEIKNGEVNNKPSLISIKDNKANGLNTAIRQAAIINRIKASNGDGCRLKDIMADFPDVSERTLRYDLRGLCEQGIIERMGNGGPSSYYTLKDKEKVAVIN